MPGNIMGKYFNEISFLREINQKRDSHFQICKSVLKFLCRF